MSRAALGNSFFYTAVRAGGGRTLGLRWARSRHALAEALRRERMLLLNAYPLPLGLGRGGTGDRALRLKEQVVLNEQLAQLLSRGVPLTEALEVAAQTVAPKAGPRIERLRDLVASGTSFSDACRSIGGFDEVTVSVYRAAERTGDLAGAAGQLAATGRRMLAVAGRAVTLMIYPAIVILVSVLVALLLLAFIVPMFGQQLIDSGIKLPGYTMLMIRTGFWMQDWWLLLLLAGAGALAVLIAFRRAVLAGVARAARTLPLIREVVLAQESARFFATMAAMTRSGVPLADALATANQAITHPTLRSQMERLRTKLVDGGVLRVLIDEVAALPLATRRLLIAAERSGDMEAAFNSLASDMTEEVDRRAQRLLAVLQPLLIIVMFVLIGSLIASVMIPILTVSSQVGN
jgi:type II secretory pathway component PulF